MTDSYTHARNSQIKLQTASGNFLGGHIHVEFPHGHHMTYSSTVSVVPVSEDSYCLKDLVAGTAIQKNAPTHVCVNMTPVQQDSVSLCN